MDNEIDFEVYAIRNLSKMTEITQVDMRIFGLVNDIEIDYTTTLWAPHGINTYSKLSEHITEKVLQVELDKKLPIAETECPIDGTPLQNNECMVCGYVGVA